MKHQVKTYVLDKNYNDNCFFILNKGYNAGKPSKEYFINSFVVVVENKKDFDFLYYAAFALYKVNFWKRFFYGSVIEFLRIGDFKREFYNAVSKVNQSKIDEFIKLINLLDTQENELFNKHQKIISLKKDLCLILIKGTF
jgi:hypothetical protein